MRGVALITGAFGALGRDVVRVLAQDGWQLSLIDAGAAPAADAEHHVLANVRLDDWQAAQSAVEAVVAHYGAVHAVVNLAGAFTWELLAESNPQAWRQMMDANLMTAVHTCLAARLHVQAAGTRGRIVNIGAAAAERAASGMGAYTASKAAVRRLTEALAEELKPHGATVNAVLPSIIDTPANRQSMGDADAGRWVSTDALARVVRFLLSDDAAPITGAGIPVTGRV
ncbi:MULTISPECIES: SDR family NAD(P)-dependent oxidoreductase [unclassified Variovorax]|uniref:SDR family NAD(P)-dependent oxidoreductase n=1 Tax=unclassified Variovorax TaxID=663243 RepID=UPI00076DDDF3|nr:MULTISPECIES: SDR family NAD(P)-dependent oxidoreductase [unclassified Variovorax]KWT74777.1 Dehydrogenase [Variovorax sp. WDL1]PNG46084.1 3-oxoacyl-[acyl-carrier-protein] reductase FabG [Variovorax sp. B2]PNG46257.1 3-oxoacyl-[acyl-carrier-protein] reductase FabG [Variovorax sp. B4]VTV19200.1 3-oxoacyl-[acyl-carrier-protein] reductase FabG [Variovorax sp. WDL1]